tara:strand:+ start:518 stop:1381 length:864 start_codon:yes stop_codon:yes gene_type:complete
MIVNSKSNNKLSKKGLFLVPTPIGNLKDITLRAIEILRNSNSILCEDTRVSKNLFQKYQIKSKFISYHKFTEKKKLSKIINILKSGEIVSLISDAGTPTISDPGSILIRECIENNINVTPLPGPSAVSTAISISGFSDKFFFYGFLPDQKKKLEKDLRILSELNGSIVFFISSKKFDKLIKHLQFFFSGREMLICKEMTKIYEEFLRYDIDKLDRFDIKLRGELTVVISEKKINKDRKNLLDESDKKVIESMIHKLSIKEIINLINTYNQVPKKLIYDYCLQLKKVD